MLVFSHPGGRWFAARADAEVADDVIEFARLLRPCVLSRGKEGVLGQATRDRSDEVGGDLADDSVSARKAFEVTRRSRFHRASEGLGFEVCDNLLCDAHLIIGRLMSAPQEARQIP